MAAKCAIPVAIVLAFSSLPCFSASLAPSKDILSLEIGGDFNLPECTARKYGQLLAYQSTYALSVRPCFQSKKAVGNGAAAIDPEGEMVRLILGKTPYEIKDDVALGEVVAGKLEGVTLYTRGVDVQDEVLRLLVAKYGEPKTRKVTSTQNRMGATFKSIDCEWVFEDLIVKMIGIGGSTDSGYVEVSSPAGQESELRRATLREAQQPKL
ncbi:MAG: hypothetical protein ABIP44_02770 [Pseudoxanthomonas sp.]